VCSSDLFCLFHLFRLHHRPTKWPDFRLFPAGSVLSRPAAVGGAETSQIVVAKITSAGVVMFRGIFILALGLLCSCNRAVDPDALLFSIIEQHPTPLLTRSSPGAQDNKYGFEGGRVLLLDGAYHLFISEM